MLNQLKTFTAARLDLEELVELSAYGKSLRAEFSSSQVEEPEWLSVALNSLRREITSRLADKQEARRRHIKASLESLKTPAEKRAQLEAELQKLEEVSA